MAKKDFSGANTGRVYDAIADATAPDTQEEYERKPRRTYSDAEKQDAMGTLSTQGKKGMKAMRINMAFSPELHDYIKVMSNVKGQTITEFVNEILRQSLEQNRETYEKAQELIRGLRSL